MSGFQRDRYDEDGGYLGKENVVSITEPRRWEWQVVLDGDRVRDFRMIGLRVPVDTVALTHVPISDLARIAQVYLDRVTAHFEDGHSVWESFLLSQLEPGETRPLDGAPTDEEFARAWHEVGPRTVEGLPRRDALAARFGVTPWAIDKWVQRVRRNTNLIPPPTTGRSNRRRPVMPDD